MTSLFIGGSSGFSSAGVSDPTCTIVQLALRLDEHLGDHLGGVLATPAAAAQAPAEPAPEAAAPPSNP
jgi:hypothetical protein